MLRSSVSGIFPQDRPNLSCRLSSSKGWRGRGVQVAGELRFKLGDSLVEEAVVIPRTSEAFCQPALVCVGLAILGPELLVLVEDSLDAVGRQVMLEVADTAAQFADLGSLCHDFRTCALQLVLSVQRSPASSPRQGLGKPPSAEPR